jgi:hypothetical protein
LSKTAKKFTCLLYLSTTNYYFSCCYLKKKHFRFVPTRQSTADSLEVVVKVILVSRIAALGRTASPAMLHSHRKAGLHHQQPLLHVITLAMITIIIINNIIIIIITSSTALTMYTK